MQEGSLRADVNVSVRQMGEKKFGTRCEIKNVNSIRFMQMAIEYEAKRQVGLKLISKKINSLIKENIDEDNDIFEISNLLEQCNSEIIKKSLQNKNTIKAIRVKNLAGVFGFEPFPGIRLGKEIGQLVRFFGIGGIFHSDELPNYGISVSGYILDAPGLGLRKIVSFFGLAALVSAIGPFLASLILLIIELIA
jgi:glutamyl-tRNA(Gln) amidotransferase subunit E